MYRKFEVFGTPVPKGSAKAFYNPKAKKIVVMQTNREAQIPWASAVAMAAKQAGVEMIRKPQGVRLIVHFAFLRAKSNRNKNHVTKPDLDKLLRCVKDSLTGIAYEDDSQVCFATASKMYDPTPGAVIEIESL